MPRGPYSRIAPADQTGLVRIGRCNIQRPKEEGSQEKLADAKIDHVVALVESDRSLMLQHVIAQQLGVCVSKATIVNSLDGRIIALKKVHAMPCQQL